MTTSLQLGANCSTGCQTKDHANWGECMRAKNTRVGWAKSSVGLDRTAQKAMEARHKEYRDARRQGIQPASTSTRDIRGAVDLSNRTGTAFDAAK